MGERGKQRRAILKVAEKKTPKQVARKTGVDLKTVKKTLRREQER
jgi:DNA-binding CsgD family transcriptional regulator